MYLLSATVLIWTKQSLFFSWPYILIGGGDRQINKYIYNIVSDYDECFEKKIKQDEMMGSPPEISSEKKILWSHFSK